MSRLLTLLRKKGSEFSPLDLPGLALWLDASDTTTITHDTGAVSQWDDKSANGFNVSQSNGAYRPTTGTQTINSLNAIAFDGSEVLQRPLAPTSNVNLLRNVAGASIFLVRRYTSVPSAVTAPVVIATALGAFRAALYTLADGHQYVGGRTIDSNSLVGVSDGEDVSAVAAQLVAGIFDYANTDLYLRIDGSGVASTTSFQTATATSDTSALRLAIGADANTDPGNAFTGYIGEVLVYESALNSTEIGQVETYLADKWGVTLP